MSDRADPGNQVAKAERRVHYQDMEEGLRQLPEYARSLLKIHVSVVVTLASTKQPISRILELSPGSIIQFDKPCEEMLTLEVGNRNVAVGEAVKVGDKFGLRLTSMTMPQERFWPIRGSKARGAGAAERPDGP